MKVLSPRFQYRLDQCALVGFFLFLSVGNLARFTSFFDVSNDLLATEVILYLVCTPLVLMQAKEVSFIRPFLLFFFFVIGSCLYGVLQHGWEVLPFLHAVRLLLIVQVGRVVGQACKRQFQGEIIPFFSWLLKSYLIVIVISALIYFLFPSSNMLWQFLAENKIHFRGDPHENRFISVYLDPNFYGAIACIPFLLSFFLFLSTNNKRYLLFLFCIGATILCTKSRSGITLFLILLFWIGLTFLRRKTSFHKKHILFSLAFFSLLLPLCKTAVLSFLARIGSIGIDPSAGLRYVAWQEGWEHLQAAPLLGMGYNFTNQIGLWVDSSLLLSCLTFGVCGTLVLLAYGLSLCYHLFLRYKGTALQPWISSFLFYIGFSIVFASLFNNLVFYIFWALPVLVIYHFFSGKEERDHA